jgi:hypothetical protein
LANHNTARPSGPRITGLLLLSAIAGTAVTASLAGAQTQAHWLSGQSGLWTDPARWTGGIAPNNGTPLGTTYHAFIDAGAASNYTVTSSGDVLLDALTLGSSRATLSLTGGNLTTPVINLENGTLSLQGGSLIGSTINVTDGLFQWGTASSVLDGVTINGTASAAGAISVRNGLTVNDPLTMSGNMTLLGSQTLTGTFHLGASSTRRLRILSSDTLTLASGSAIRGSSLVVGAENSSVRSGHLINNGLISAEQSGSLLHIPTESLVNNGTLQAVNGGNLVVYTLIGDANQVLASGTNSKLTLGGTYTLNQPVMVADGALLTLNGSWTNAAGITATNGSQVNLTGALTSASLANIARTGGSRLGIAGTYDNTGQTFTIDAANPDIRLVGGTISGGTVAGGDGQVLIVSGESNFNNVIHSGALTVESIGTLNLNGAWSNQGGTIHVNGGGARLNLNGTYTSAGLGTITQVGGEVILSGAMDNSGQTLSIDAARTNWLYNQATVSGGILNITGGATLKAPGSYALNLAGVTLTGATTLSSTNIHTTDLVNQAAVVVSNGAIVKMDGNWSNTGTFNLNGGTVRLGGEFERSDLSGFSVINGGVLTITGAMDNTGGTMSTAEFGQVRLDGGVITGGTLTGTDNGPRLRVFNNASSRLQGVTVDGGLLADDATGQVDTTLFLSGGTTVSGVVDSAVNVLDIDATSSVDNTIMLRNGGSLHLHGTRTLSTAVQLQSSHPSFPVNEIGVDAGSTLTIDGTGSVVGGQSRVGVRLGGSDENAIVNNGTIKADIGNGLMSVEADQFTNNGVLEAVGAGQLSVRNIQGNLNTARIVNGGSSAQLTLDGVYTINTPLSAAGGTLTLNGGWTNAAGINATNATVNLGGAFTQAGIGSITRGGTTKVNISGTLDNTAATLTLSSAATQMGLNGGVILGGSVVTSNGQRLEQRAGNSLLSGVTVNGDVAVQAGVLTADSGTSFNGDVSIAQGAAMQFPSWMTVSSGTFTFAATSGNGLLRAVPEAGNTLLTLGPSVVVHGGNGLVGEAGTTVTNNGLISADVAGRSIVVQGSSFVNNGTIEAVSGGRLIANGLTGDVGTARSLGAGSELTLGGTYTLDEPVTVTGGMLTLNGAWTNSAGVVADNALINLGGAFTSAGIGPITSTGSTLVNITGALDNTGATLTIDSPVGALGLAGGSISGGLVVTGNGQALTQRSGTSSLAGVTVSGRTAVMGGTLNADSATTFGGPIVIGSGTLNVASGSTLGVDDIFFDGSAAGVLRPASGTLTLGPTAVAGALERTPRSRW